MSEIEELEEIIGCLENIEPFGIEPDSSSLGIEPFDVLGFSTQSELEKVINHLTTEFSIDKYSLPHIQYK